MKCINCNHELSALIGTPSVIQVILAILEQIRRQNKRNRLGDGIKDASALREL